MKFGVIGYGNMGKALVRGLVHTGVFQQDILVNVRSEKSRNAVKEEFTQIYVTKSKNELLENADAVILAVEPKNAEEVLSELGAYDIEGKVIISFMAGITREEIKQMLGESADTTKIIRVMPNIAIANGNGVLGINYEEDENETVREVVQALKKLGYLLALEEEQLDSITVTAASGLAFAASLMNSYQHASNTLLRDEVQSREITLRIFENVIDMMKKENCSFEDIIKRITTKGGTTEAGMNALPKDMITEGLEHCVQKSYERCRKII